MINIPAGIYSAQAIRTIAGVFLALCTVAVIGRFWARRLQRAPILPDDWLMIPAWVCYIGVVACLIESTSLHVYGFSPSETADLDPSDHDRAIIKVALDIFLALCLGFTKMSAFQFYKRVFCIPGQASAFRNAANISMIVTMLWMVAFIVLPLAECGDHFDGLWLSQVFQQNCANTGHAYLAANSSTDVFLELVVIFLPIWKIWSLHTSLKRKMAISLVFLTALLSLAAALGRMALIAMLFADPKGAAAIGFEADSTIFNLWLLESGASILAINMPSLWYFHKDEAHERVVRSLRNLRSMTSLMGGRSRDSASDSARNTGPASLEAGTINKRRTVFGASGSRDKQAMVNVHITSGSMHSESHADTIVATENDIKVTYGVVQSVENV